MVSCCAPTCNHNTRRGFRLFRFPTDPSRRKIWKININRHDWEPGPSSRLCESHFDDDQYEPRIPPDAKRRWRKLRRNAIPTLFCPTDFRKQATRRDLEGNADEEDDEDFLDDSCLSVKEDIAEEQEECSGTEHTYSKKEKALLVVTYGTPEDPVGLSNTDELPCPNCKALYEENCVMKDQLSQLHKQCKILQQMLIKSIREQRSPAKQLNS